MLSKWNKVGRDRGERKLGNKIGTGNWPRLELSLSSLDSGGARKIWKTKAGRRKLEGES